MRVYIRKLNSRFDPNETEHIQRKKWSRGPSDDWYNHILASAEAPRNVHATDSEIEVDRAESMLLQGELSVNDLVRTEDGCWLSLQNSPLFIDACERLNTRRKRLRRLYWSIFIVVVIAVGIIWGIHGVTPVQ